MPEYTTKGIVLWFALNTVSAATAPWEGGGTPLCSTECSIAASKLSYIPGKTYSYSYTGKSMVELKGVEVGVSEEEWQKQVEVTWLSPCDMAITVKVSGTQGGPDDRFLQKYPMVAAVSDGRVHHVCSHPNDEAWAINIKKGIASAFQNSLPSFSIIRTPQNLTETDVVGKCPTSYQVEGEGNRVVVTKEKNHRTCSQRYNTPSETHLPWLKTPLPIQESWSKCTQEINNGIYSSIRCEDLKVIKPMYGSYKFVHAKQESTLRYQSMTDTQPDAISTLSQGHLVKKTLNFDYQAPQKEESLVPQLEQTLSNICNSTKDALEHNTAGLMAQALHIMRRVPHQTLPQILQKIRSKQICPDNPKLESLFLDAIAFAQEAGSVKIMVDEIVSGRVMGGRTALYTAAFYLLPRPSIEIVSALQPLFESERPPTSTKLAAASMVNRYCRQNRHCYDEAQVKSVAQALSNKLQNQCPSSSTPKPALATLKALANMGVITPEVASSVLTCMETETPNINVRVAAAQAFRLAKCHHQSTRRLVNYAVDEEKNTEVRIAAYLAAVRCIRQEDIARIVERISIQPNTQVRGFILSHLINLQQSDALEKQHLRYMLTNYTLPRNFEVDIRKYSRNIDLSYWAPSLGLGAGLESNIIYSPGSFIPRSLDFNLTAALDGIPLHIGELGARIQGLEPVLSQVFGPEGYIMKSSYERILQDVIRLILQGNDVVERWRVGLDRTSLLSSFLSKIYSRSRSEVQADLYFRYNGQELNFATLTGTLQDISPGKLRNIIISYIQDFLTALMQSNTDSAHTVQINLDYSFPTIQGTALKLQLIASIVAALKLQGNLLSILSGSSRGQSTLSFTPSLSIEMDGFVGYDSYLGKTGLKTKNTISSANSVSVTINAMSDSGLHAKLDIPNRMELINVESDTYLMKSNKSGEPETRITPPFMRDIRTSLRSCITSFESVLGLKLCYDIDVPDVFLSNSLPLLSHPVKLQVCLHKFDPAMKGYYIDTVLQNVRNQRKVSFDIRTYGAARSLRADASLTCVKEQDYNMLTVAVHGTQVSSKMWITVPKKEGELGMELFYAFNTENFDFSRGGKVSLTSASTSTSQALECLIYYGQSRIFPWESQVFQAKFNKDVEQHRVSLDALVRTTNVLTNYLEFYLEVGGEFEYIAYRLPLPTKLHKLEFQGGLAGWKVVSFLRKASESGGRVVYTSSYKVSRRGEDLVSVAANYNSQGRPGVNLVLETTVKGEFGSSVTKGALTMYYERTRVGIDLQVLQPYSYPATDLDSLSTLLYLQALYTQAGADYVLKLQLNVPALMDELRAAIRATPDLHKDSVTLEVGVKSGGRVILHVLGPVSIVLTHSYTDVQTNFAVVHNLSDPYRLAANFTVRNNAQIVSLGVWSRSHPLFLFKLSTTSPQSDETIINTELLLPVYVELQSCYRITPRNMYLDFNALLLPGSRRIKGMVEYERVFGKVRGEVVWENSRHGGGMASLEAMLVHNKPFLNHYALIGALRIPSKPYVIMLDTALGDPPGGHYLACLVHTPRNNTIVVEMLNVIARHSSITLSDQPAPFPFADDKIAIALLKRLVSMFLGDDSTPFSDWDHSTLSVLDVVDQIVPSSLDSTPLGHHSPSLITSATRPLASLPLNYNLNSIPMEPITFTLDPLMSGAHSYPDPFFTTTHMRYKDLQSNKEYKWLHKVMWEPRSHPQGFKLSTGVQYKSPSGRDTNLSTSLLYETSSSQECLVSVQGQVLLPPLKSPVGVNFTLIDSPTLFSVILLSNDSACRTAHGACFSSDLEHDLSESYGPSVRILEWQVERLSPSGEVSSFNVALDLIALKNIMDDVKDLVQKDAAMPEGVCGSDDDEEEEEGEGEVGCETRARMQDSPPLGISFCSRYVSPEPGTHTLIFQSPSSAVEARYSPLELVLHFYPNRDESDTKYELTAKSSHTFYGTKYEGRVSHPILSRDVAGHVLFSSSGSGVQGSFELDIFPDTADKVTGTLHSTPIANNTVRVEGNFTTRALGSWPTVTIEAGMAPQTLTLGLTFRKSYLLPPSLSAMAKYDRLEDQEATVAVSVVGEEGGVMVEALGVVRQDSGPGCRGPSLSLATFTSVLGRRNFLLSSCRPGFLQMGGEGLEDNGLEDEGLEDEGLEDEGLEDEGLEDEGLENEGLEDVMEQKYDQETYSVTLGLLDSEAVEVSVYKTLQKETHTVALAHIMPRLPYLDLVYRYQEFGRWKETVKDDCGAMWRGCTDWVTGVWQKVKDEARLRNITFPPEEISNLSWNIKRDIEYIALYMFRYRVEPAWEALRHLTNTPFATFARRHAYKFWLLLRWMERDITGDAPHVYTSHWYWKDQVEQFNFLVRAGVMQAITEITSGAEDVRASVRHLLDWLEGTRMLQLAREDIVEAMERRLTQERVESLVEMVEMTTQQLEDDLSPLRGNPALIWLAVIASSNINSMVESVSLTPASTLSNALWSYNSYSPGPFTTIARLGYILFPRHYTDLLPPFNRSAQVIGGTEILTFDGARLKVPLSPCRVILAAYDSTIVSLSHPNPNLPAPELTVTTPDVTVSIKDHYQVKVNGRRVVGRDVTVHGVTVRTSGLQITVILPLMSLRVSTDQQLVTIVASGWTYGRLAGILGTYDGEASNDHLTSTGVWASSTRDLVASWQEDETCHTPQVPTDPPATPTLERRVHCYPLMGVWARCNAVIRPEPYVSLCYVTPSPCDAAQAYRTVCTTKGLEPLIPRGC